MKSQFKDKKILVIGGTGTIGRRIVDMLLEFEPEVVRIFSRDEYKQFMMQNELKSNNSDKLRFLLGDVRDYERVLRASRGIDIIFHVAAMKHVPACEYNPFEAVKTNVIGTQNVIQAAVENNVGKVVFTSSDKAISPTNAMGATKLLAERLISSASYSQGAIKTVFSAVRFGNVMGSRGSVIPLFEKQILEQGKITITNSDMSRFMMSITDAAKLTIEAVSKAKGGEVFVLKMPVLKLGDLAEVVIEEVCLKYGIPKDKVVIDNIGLRPGEKMFEELMTAEEAYTAIELPNMYAITPAFSEKDYSSHYKTGQKAADKSYSSENQMNISKDMVRDILKRENLI